MEIWSTKSKNLLKKNGQISELKLQSRPLTYAIYRILYGEDFIEDSIMSIMDFVDKIFVFWDDVPWGGVKSAKYKGKVVPIPIVIDHVVDRVKLLSSKYPWQIVVQYDHTDVNTNQVTHLVNDHILTKYPKPQLLLFIEWVRFYKKNSIV